MHSFNKGKKLLWVAARKYTYNETTHDCKDDKKVIKSRNMWVYKRES